MNVDRARVFKSVDARKQNPQNKPTWVPFSELL